MNTYHYSLEGKSIGPVTLEKLKVLNLTKETLVWKEGLSHWVKAGELEELEVLFKAGPPPLNQTVAPPLQRSASSTPSEDLEERKDRQKRLFIWLGIAVGLLVFIILVMNIGKSKKSTNKEETISGESVPATEETSVPTEAAPAAESYQYETNSQTAYTPPKREKTKTQGQLNLELSQKEINNPSVYISASFTSKVNLAANTVLEGHLYNSASLANFQNIVFKVRFLSKVGEELNSETFTISTFLPAGGSAYFKHKVYGWTPKVDHLDYTIISAEGFYDEPCAL